MHLSGLGQQILRLSTFCPGLDIRRAGMSSTTVMFHPDAGMEPLPITLRPASDTNRTNMAIQAPLNTRQNQKMARQHRRQSRRVFYVFMGTKCSEHSGSYRASGDVGRSTRCVKRLSGLPPRRNPRLGEAFQRALIGRPDTDKAGPDSGIG